MELFITVEGQNCTENGLARIMYEVTQKLDFVTNRCLNLENVNNYGEEFRSIAVIPSCMDEDFWSALGWKERKLISRKKGEADIRLCMDYNRFINETEENKRLMCIAIIVKSIMVVMEKSKCDFKGEALIRDILNALNVNESELSEWL